MLDEIIKEQFILGVRNNVAYEKLIIHQPANFKDVIEYRRLLEVVNKTVLGSFNSNVKPILPKFPAGNDSQANDERQQY